MWDKTDLSLALSCPQLQKFCGVPWPTVDTPVIDRYNDSIVQLNRPISSHTGLVSDNEGVYLYQEIQSTQASTIGAQTRPGQIFPQPRIKNQFFC